MSGPDAGGPDADGYDADVLVVGTGPTGGAAALALATYGVRVHAVTRWNWLANTPRAHITNQRTVEVLRDLGVEAEATKHATPWEQMGDTLFATSLAGPEIARLRTWGTGPDRATDYLTGSPCPMLDIPQPHLEPVLVGAAAARGATFAFTTEYLGHTQDDSGVTVALRDLTTSREYTLRARYMIGADGARSQVVEELGLPMEGELARAATAYVLFRADLSRYVEHRPSILHWLMTPSAAFGEIGMGLLRAIRPWHTWIAGWGYALDGPGPDFDPESVTARIRGYVGDPDLEIEIESCSSWYVNQAHATRYSSGRVFCGGDAVHRHPPSSGLGSNTSIQDAFNLAWKLAFVVHGHAGPELLETYSDERVPVGAQVVARANRSRVDYAPLNECFRTTGEADPVAAGLAKLRDPGPDGVAVREALTAALELKNHEFNAQGVELNQRYASTAVVPDGDAGEEVFARDRELHLQATTRPGAKLPHAWLVDGAGRRTSTLDVTGKGRMSLVTGLSGGSWVRAAAKLDLPFLRTVVIGAPGAEDAYRDWARLREVHEAGALLVRPDGYVAWRHGDAVRDDDDALARLRSALSAALSADY
ncbi:FAD-dependent monooxygenase [Pseudonocardia broussonetiae]|uniref:2,4-dichlorophenol 6-monooxygenase n=1 Tax=Pseudonocardia broussonetiae TaxID=2736640 RepID=A0A6M6JHE9_9PSEU|nr:FAD-dependent monooxygenase [Pseudonocardia broussonetiae]QJY47458.1 2,4-dichlorophenol 6-monooxygenase [Pseudonocardia broussonetiae]